MAKVSDGYTIGSIEGAIKEVLTCKRKLQLRIRPLAPVELINALWYLFFFSVYFKLQIFKKKVYVSV